MERNFGALSKSYYGGIDVKIVSFLKKMFMNKVQWQKELRRQGVEIGENCDIEKSANFGSEPFLVKIGDNVRITKGVQFITHDGGGWTLRKMGLIPKNSVKYGAIFVDDNCNISWNVIIMPGVHIGKNCVIAAGAVVTKSVPDGMVYGGIPARKIETIEEYCKKYRNDGLPCFGLSMQEKKKIIMEQKPDIKEIFK